jgi:CheY-like chemotaxis protein
MTPISTTAMPHLLVVEDDRDLREVLSESLRFEGYEVEEAADGVDALARLQEGVRPTLIILDLIMPRMDGRQLLAAMQRDEALAGIPVVLVTGTPPLDLRGDVHAILKKPVGMDELLACIRRVAPCIATTGAVRNRTALP